MGAGYGLSPPAAICVLVGVAFNGIGISRSFVLLDMGSSWHHFALSHPSGLVDCALHAAVSGGGEIRGQQRRRLPAGQAVIAVLKNPEEKIADQRPKDPAMLPPRKKCLLYAR